MTTVEVQPWGGDVVMSTSCTTGATWTFYSGTMSSGNYSTTYSTTTSTSYGTWYNVFNVGYLQPMDDLTATPVPQMSDEEITRQQQVEREERLQAARAAAVEREAAQARAHELLCSLLPEEQREPYRMTGVFEIIGSHGTRYRIRRGIAGNIDWLDDDGRVGGSLCCHAPVGGGDRWIPTADVMVGQVLALKTDEAEFLRIANVARGRRPVLA